MWNYDSEDWRGNQTEAFVSENYGLFRQKWGNIRGGLSLNHDLSISHINQAIRLINVTMKNFTVLPVGRCISDLNPYLSTVVPPPSWTEVPLPPPSSPPSNTPYVTRIIKNGKEETVTLDGDGKTLEARNHAQSPSFGSNWLSAILACIYLI